MCERKERYSEGTRGEVRTLIEKPCRETALSRIEGMIEATERHLRALHDLKKLAALSEPGSPVEDLLYTMLSRLRLSDA